MLTEVYAIILGPLEQDRHYLDLGLDVTISFKHIDSLLSIVNNDTDVYQRLVISWKFDFFLYFEFKR